MRQLAIAAVVLVLGACANSGFARGGGPPSAPTTFSTAGGTRPTPPQAPTQLAPLSNSSGSNLVNTQGDWAPNPWGY